MSVTILQPGKFRRDAIVETCKIIFELDPEYAQHCASHLKELHRAQYSKTGEWRSKLGRVEIRLPQRLYMCLVAAFRKLGIEPGFAAEDTDDIKVLCEEFPDFAPRNS